MPSFFWWPSAVSAYEAVGRLNHPTHPAGITIIWVASVGVLINGVTAFLFISGRKSNLNIRGAFLHMAADAGVSAGVVLAGNRDDCDRMAMARCRCQPCHCRDHFHQYLGASQGFFQFSTRCSPPDILILRRCDNICRAYPGVSQVHDLHVWGMSTTEVALTAHLVQAEPER